MYILIFLLAIVMLLMGFRQKKKLRYKNNIRFTERINKKLSKLHYKKDSKQYRDLQQKVINAGIRTSTETFQSIKIILPFAAVVFYILFKILNYVNLSLNMNELAEAARVLNDDSLLNISLNINPSGIIFIGAVAFLLPDLMLKFMAKMRTGLSKKESLILQTYTIMLLKTSKPVKQILISLYERADYFKPVLEKAINKFSASPEGALEELKNSAPQNDFKNICIALQQALNGDRKLSVIYLQNHRNLAREVNKQIRIRNQTKNQGIGIILMMLPILASIAIVGYPWLVYTIRAIGQIPT